MEWFHFTQEAFPDIYLNCFWRVYEDERDLDQDDVAKRFFRKVLQRVKRHCDVFARGHLLFGCPTNAASQR